MPPTSTPSPAAGGPDEGADRTAPTPTPRRRLDISGWSLRAKLVASMLALFTAISLITGLASVVALNRFLTGQIDEQLRSSLGRFVNSPDGRLPDSDVRRGPGNEGLLASLAGDLGIGWATGANGQRVSLTAEQLTLLDDASLGREPETVDLGGSVGAYRVMAASAATRTGGSATIIVGLPTEPQERTLSAITLAAGTTGLLGLVVMGVAGGWLVKRNLRPLTRVAATATRVSKLPLATGKVALAERVPERDTDRRTEVGQVGAALNGLLDHVDNALNERHRSEQRVRQFVADASHELRTPLASIRGYAELTRREREPVPASVSHALSRVESEATRMSSLVDDLLLLARLDAGRPLDADEVDLSELVVNAVSDAHAASPDHTWALDLPGEPVLVRGDTARLHQIVANLLGNARVHTVPGTTVRTSLAQHGDRVRLSVHDDGPGVPEQLQPNVFQRFARGDTSRSSSAGSTGLGLSIVAAVAQAHGGSVEMSSRPGDTTFSVVLPAEDATPRAATAPIAAPVAPPTASPGRVSVGSRDAAG